MGDIFRIKLPYICLVCASCSLVNTVLSPMSHIVLNPLNSFKGIFFKNTAKVGLFHRNLKKKSINHSKTKTCQLDVAVIKELREAENSFMKNLTQSSHNRLKAVQVMANEACKQF